MTIGKLVEEANNAFDIKPIDYETTPERSIFVDGVIEGYAIRSKELNEKESKACAVEDIIRSLVECLNKRKNADIPFLWTPEEDYVITKAEEFLEK